MKRAQQILTPKEMTNSEQQETHKKYKNMKTILKVTIALALIFNFTSCKKELTDVHFDTTITENIEVSVTPEKSSKGVISFNEEIIIDLKNGNGKINDYQNYIKEIDVKEFSYKFISNNINATITGDLYVNNVKYKSVVDMSLNELVALTEPYFIESLAHLNTISSKLMDNKKVTVRYSGTINNIDSEEAIEFKIKVVSKLNVIANAF